LIEVLLGAWQPHLPSSQPSPAACRL
jgi:hypothetical protein